MVPRLASNSELRGNDKRGTQDEAINRKRLSGTDSGVIRCTSGKKAGKVLERGVNSQVIGNTS